MALLYGARGGTAAPAARTAPPVTPIRPRPHANLHAPRCADTRDKAPDEGMERLG